RRAAAEQIVAGLDQRADELATALPRLRADEVATRDRAERLTALETEMAKRPALTEELRSATAAAREADELARRADQRANQVGIAARELRRTEDRQSGIARNARVEVAQLPVTDETDESSLDTAEPLEVLRAEFRKAEADYAAVKVGAELQTQLAAAEKQSESARLAVEEIDRDDRNQAEALLSTPDGADAASRAAATEQAERALGVAQDRLQHAVTEVALQERAYAQYKPQARSLDPYGPPRDVAHGTALIREVERDTQVAARQATELARKKDVADAEVGRVEASVDGFRTLVASLDDLTAEQPDPDVPAFEEDIDSALTRWKKTKSTLREAAALREEADRPGRGAADPVAQHAQLAELDTVASPVRRHILGVSRADMPGLATEWEQALRPRLTSLVNDLSNIGRHRAGIV